MPKKIFNSDLETSGGVKAASIITDTFTLNGGVLTANTLTDGTATLSGGVLTANTLTDGTATLSGGVLTANTLTDGTATLNGGVLTANTLTDGTATLSGGVLTASTVSANSITAGTTTIGVNQIRSDRITDGTALITQGKFNGNVEADTVKINDIGSISSNGTSGFRLNKPYTSEVWELGSFDSNGTYPSLKTHTGGYHTSLYSKGSVNVALDTDADNSDPDSLRFAVYRNSEVDASGGDPVDSGATELFKVNGSGTCYIDGENVKISHGSAYSEYRVKAAGLNFVVDEDEDSTNDYFNFNSGTQTLFRLTRGTSSTNISHFLQLPSPPNLLQPPELELIANHTTPQDSITNLVSRGHIEFLFGTGYTSRSAHDDEGRTVSFKTPNWAGEGILSPAGKVTQAMLNSAGVLYVRGSYTPFTGSHVYLSDTPIQVGSSVILVENKVAISSIANSTTVAGICGSCKPVTQLSDEELKDSLRTANIVEGYLVTVAAVGDSRTQFLPGFNVCNENGDIQPGDLLVTSNTPGYLMKQDDDIIRSCTVGKAMEAVTFDANGQATGIYGYIYCG